MNTFRSRLFLLLIDIALINIAFVLGYFLRYQIQLFREIVFNAPLADYFGLQVLFNATLLFFFWTDNVYSLRSAAWFDQVTRIAGAVFKMPFVLWTAIFIVGPTVYSRLMIGYAGVLTVLLLGLARGIKLWLEARLRKRGIGVSNLLIVGAGDLGRAVMRTVFARPDLGYRCVGFVDDDPLRGQTDIGRFPALGEIDAIAPLLGEHAINDVVITLPWSAQQKIVEIVNLCQKRGVRVRVVPSILQINYSQVDVNDFGGIPVLGIRGRTVSPVNRLIKRLSRHLFWRGNYRADRANHRPGSDRNSAGIARAGDLYAKTRRDWMANRSGYLNCAQCGWAPRKSANSLKSLNEADGPMFKIKEDPRITNVGRLIRKLSLDELPQFWNVLRGEMSIVGPRPALMNEVANYDDWHRERLRVKPGITGLWQISGRSEFEVRRDGAAGCVLHRELVAPARYQDHAENARAHADRARGVLSANKWSPPSRWTTPGAAYRFMRGSNASRKPSPKNVNEITSMATANAITSKYQGLALIAPYASRNMRPQLVTKNSRDDNAGRKPRPI